MQCIQSITHKLKHMQCIQSLLFFSSTIHIQMAAGSMNFKLLKKKNTEKKRNWKKVMKLWMSQMRCMLKSFGDNHKQCWNFENSIFEHFIAPFYWIQSQLFKSKLEFSEKKKWKIISLHQIFLKRKVFLHFIAKNASNGSNNHIFFEKNWKERHRKKEIDIFPLHHICSKRLNKTCKVD